MMQNETTNTINSSTKSKQSHDRRQQEQHVQQRKNGRQQPQRRNHHLNNTEEIIRILEKRIHEEAPKRGYVPSLAQRVAFRALPISELTLMGLENDKNSNKNNHKNKKNKNHNNTTGSTTTTTSSSSTTTTAFTTMTAIQNACIPHALAGRDILGAAKTGSGKTLAFLIPVLELLYRHQYTSSDGPGAIILVPTRELAVQIFQVLKKIGSYHTTLTVGLLIGGKKDFYSEQQHIGTTNIIIATPGRLLQHLEQTSTLDMSQLRIVVLDEADRILDMGFREQLIRILEYLPSNNHPQETKDDYDDDRQQQPQQQSQLIRRQTLLFSATQTRDVSALASLSLHQPEYIGVHDQEKVDTPETLQQQSYVIVPLEHKLNAIYTFIKTHLKYKTIIFINTCSQVRYIYELLCTLRPGITIVALHGKLTQERRTQIYFDYIHKQHVVLLATDIAARGLDFPNIDWIVQMDVPEDRDMYIHRVGRTARYKSTGKSLLMITPQEATKGYLETVLTNVPLQKFNINPTNATSVTARAASAVASNVRLQELAKKAFYSYIRCIHLMPYKHIFSITDIEYDAYSQSLGLAMTPSLTKILALTANNKHTMTRDEYRQAKNVNLKLQRLKEQIKIEKLNKKIQQQLEKNPTTNKKGTTEEDGTATADDPRKTNLKKRTNPSKDESDDDDDDDDDELLVPKQESNNNTTKDDEDDDAEQISYNINQVSKSRHPKKIRMDGSNGINTKILFNEDGTDALPVDVDSMIATTTTATTTTTTTVQELASANDQYVQTVRNRLEQTKEIDNQIYKERVREKKMKKKQQQQNEREVDDNKGKFVGSATLHLPVKSYDDDDETNDNDDSDSESAEQDDDDDGDDTDETSSGDNNDEDTSHVDSSDDHDDDESETIDVQAQEEIALSLIRRG